MTFDHYESVELENKLCETLDSFQIQLYETIKEQHYAIGIEIDTLEKSYHTKIKQLFDILKEVDIVLKIEESEN